MPKMTNLSRELAGQSDRPAFLNGSAGTCCACFRAMVFGALFLFATLSQPVSAAIGTSSSYNVAPASATVGTSAAGVVSDPGLPPLPPGEEIYDLRKPRPVPFPWGWYLVRLVGAGILAWVVFKLSARLMHGGQIDPAQEPPAPPPDPLEEALAALRRLRESSLWREGRYKDICEHLALVFKVFLHDRFGLGIGAASTVGELVSDLRGKSVDPSLCRQVEDLLELFDAVKYAAGDLGGIPLENLHDRILALIRREDWQP